MSNAEMVFWAAGILLLYTYIGYPLMLWLAARIGMSRVEKANFEPTINIVVLVHNESHRIINKIENLLALDYPSERMQIIIASDASTDNTVALARRYEHAGVRVLAFGERRGKPGVLNEVIPMLEGEIIVLMDVRQRVAEDALRKMLANFADPKVGAVSGELIMQPAEQGKAMGEGLGFYWHYEKAIRQNESRLDSTVGVTGAMYAIRRSLFESIPDNSILDDVVIPMQITRRGYRVLFESSAYAYDIASPTPRAEFTRKVRTIAGNFQMFAQHPWLLNPFANRLFWQTVSHKLFRLLGPVCLVLVLVSNVLLLNSAFYATFMVLQLLFYAAAGVGQLVPPSRNKPIIISVPQTFCLLNWATTVGFYRFLLGRQRVTWDKAPVKEN